MKKSLILVLCLLWGGLANGASDPVLLKNFREIYASYASIMQVDQKDTELLELYRLNKNRLPAVGLPSELSSPVILAVTELAGAFCKKVVDREVSQEVGERVLFPDVDFEVGPLQFQSFLKKRVSQRLAQLFWQRDANTDELVSLAKHIDSLGKTEASAPEATQRLLHILCTTYGTSLAFLVK